MRAFNHVLIIMFENQYRGYVMQNSYMRGLASQGVDMAYYFGVMHPSQTNYISSIAGELCNVTSDHQPPPLPQRTIVDLIEESPDRLTWGAYIDSYIPQNQAWRPDMIPKDEYPYVIKHNPFSSFANIIRYRERWKRIVNEAALFQDILNGTLPEYCWFTPNMWNDGHYLDGKKPSDPDAEPTERAPALVDQAARWLEGFFTALKFPGPESHLPSDTLVVVTFDESDFENDYDPAKAYKYTYDGPNMIYTVLLGDSVQPGVQTEGYNHYSLLRTVEKNFELGSLGKNDEDCNWFRFLWGEQFRWGPPKVSALESHGEFDIIGFRGALYLVYADEVGDLWLRVALGDSWSDPRPVGAKCHGSLRLAVSGDQLILVSHDECYRLQFLTYTLEKGWSAEGSVVEQPTRAFAVASYGSEGALMLVWRGEDDKLQSKIYSARVWGETQPVGFSSDGDVSLGILGPTLLLICKTPGQQTLFVVSYNTAKFNVVTLEEGKYAGPYDDTTIYHWSPSKFPVSFFASAPNPATPGEPEPVRIPYSAGPGVAVATLDGVVHLVHPSAENPQVMTETFSLSGLMTPKLPISYNASDKTTTSNGYGTLAQAGWSEQVAITGVFQDGPCLAITKFEDSLVIVFRNREGRLAKCSGKYAKIIV